MAFVLIHWSLTAYGQGLEYVLEDFNDQVLGFNDFNGNAGKLNGDFISLSFDITNFVGSAGASLKVKYDFSSPGSPNFTGFFHSLWDHTALLSSSIDFTDIFGVLNNGPDRDFEELRFFVKGSGQSSNSHTVKIELKDFRNRTAYTNITIHDSDTNWSEVVLDANVTSSSWSCNNLPPDPTKMKTMAFVIEKSLNNSSGTFYIDQIRFVDTDDTPVDPTLLTDDDFLDLVSERTFLYFLDWYNWDTGLVRERSTCKDLFSTAATGFGLSALAIGERRDWIDRRLAIAMITNTLHHLYDGPPMGTNGYKGFFYHFLDENGIRKDQESELSIIDTAILLAGIITVREHFNDVQDIVDLADKIYRRVEWDWARDTNANLFYLSWKPESNSCYQVPAPGSGYFSNRPDGSPLHWDYSTDEVMLINLLAIGSPTHPVTNTVFYAWQRVQGAYSGHTFVKSFTGALDTYFLAHLWIDFSILGPDKHPIIPVDWWSNSVLATRANYQYAVNHHDDTVGNGDSNYTTYAANSWGITACDGPYQTNSYRAYGVPPSGGSSINDGTIAIHGAASSIIFDPTNAIAALRHYFRDTDMWRYRFGFGDAYNLDPPSYNGFPWYNHAALGINQGSMLLAIENHRSGFLWDTVKGNTNIRTAIYAIWPNADLMSIRTGSRITGKAATSLIRTNQMINKARGAQEKAWWAKELLKEIKAFLERPKHDGTNLN